MENKSTHSTIEKLLTVMGVQFESIEIVGQDDRLLFKIKTTDEKLLIGLEGEVLNALSHVVRKMVYGKLPTTTVSTGKISIDINNYQKNRENRLKEKAQEVAGRVSTDNIAIEMDPMSSYDRLIVHTALVNSERVRTHSVGEGASRRIIISPFV